MPILGFGFLNQLSSLTNPLRLFCCDVLSGHVLTYCHECSLVLNFTITVDDILHVYTLSFVETIGSFCVCFLMLLAYSLQRTSSSLGLQ